MRSDHSDFARQEDPLGAIGASLAAAARRRTTRLRRRRRGLVATAATAATLLATGAAVAVTGTSTGVAVLDRWIGHATDPRAPGEPFYPRGRSAPRVDRSPSGGFSPAVEIPAPGGETLVAAGYAARDGSICSVMLDSADTSKAPRGGRGCLGARLLRREPRRSSRPARRRGRLAAAGPQGPARRLLRRRSRRRGGGDHRDPRQEAGGGRRLRRVAPTRLERPAAARLLRGHARPDDRPHALPRPAHPVERLVPERGTGPPLGRQGRRLVALRARGSPSDRRAIR